jgi:hypothetical protein
MRHRLRRVALLAVLAALAGAWLRGVTGERGALNVVVITLDTTRADRLSTYGYTDATPPAVSATLDAESPCSGRAAK